jgi:hypothetical protein
MTERENPPTVYCTASGYWRIFRLSSAAAIGPASTVPPPQRRLRGNEGVAVELNEGEEGDLEPVGRLDQ